MKQRGGYHEHADTYQLAVFTGSDVSTITHGLALGTSYTSRKQVNTLARHGRWCRGWSRGLRLVIADTHKLEQ